MFIWVERFRSLTTCQMWALLTLRPSRRVRLFRPLSCLSSRSLPQTFVLCLVLDPASSPCIIADFCVCQNKRKNIEARAFFFGETRLSFRQNWTAERRLCFLSSQHRSPATSSIPQEASVPTKERERKPFQCPETRKKGKQKVFLWMTTEIWSPPQPLDQPGMWQWNVDESAIFLALSLIRCFRDLWLHIAA